MVFISGYISKKSRVCLLNCLAPNIKIQRTGAEILFTALSFHPPLILSVRQHKDPDQSSSAYLLSSGLFHVVTYCILAEHGHGKCNVAVGWAVDHSLADDLCPPRPQALGGFIQRGFDV